MPPSFDSPEVFTRAFQRQFGMPPGTYRRTQQARTWRSRIILRPCEWRHDRVHVVTVWQRP